MKSSISRAAPTPMPTAAVVSSPIQPPPATKSSVSKFDVSQTIYGATKDVWAYGKTVPYVTNVLGLADAVATKVLDMTFHVDYAAVDDKIKPQLKKLDDDIVTPVIETVWNVIAPAVGKANEMVVEPVMKEVVPKVMASVVAPVMASFFVDEKKEQAKKSAIDMSPTPEVVPAFN